MAFVTSSFAVPSLALGGGSSRSCSAAPLRRRALRPTCRRAPSTTPKMVAISPDAVEVELLQEDPRVTRGFNAPQPIPEAGIEEALRLMRSGDLFRYNRADAHSTVSYAELALARYTGHRYCVALNSCGSALFLCLLAAGVRRNDEVLLNALTFNAVPSAVHHAGARAVLVESTDEYVVDVRHLEQQMRQHPRAKVLLLSHMRGRVSDMHAVAALCDAHGVTLLEDCAHSLGVLYDGAHTGHFGLACGVSAQSYKMLNSGEGGFLLTNDDAVAARAIAYAGGYERLFRKHLCSPPDSAFQAVNAAELPNYSLRMHNLTAAVLIPQIATLERRVLDANARYELVAELLREGAERASLPIRVPYLKSGVRGSSGHHSHIRPCQDSLQFNVGGALAAQKGNAARLCALCAERGVPLAIFGADGNARNFGTWGFLYGGGGDVERSAWADGAGTAGADDGAMRRVAELPRTRRIIDFAADVRLPPQFSEDDLRMIVKCILAAAVTLNRELRAESLKQ